MPFKKNIIPKYCGNFMTFIFKVNYGGLKGGFQKKEKLKIPTESFAQIKGKKQNKNKAQNDSLFCF